MVQKMIPNYILMRYSMQKWLPVGEKIFFARRRGLSGPGANPHPSSA